MHARPPRNIELALWIRYQEKETEVPVEPAGVRTVFYCGVIEPTERRRKRSQIVDQAQEAVMGPHTTQTVECLTWFSIKLTTLCHKISDVASRYLICFFPASMMTNGRNHVARLGKGKQNMIYEQRNALIIYGRYIFRVKEIIEKIILISVFERIMAAAFRE